MTWITWQIKGVLRAMKEKIMIYTLGMCTAIGISALAADAGLSQNPFPVFLDERSVDIEGYNIDGHTYVSLRELSEFLGFNVDFTNNQIHITTIQDAENATEKTQSTESPLEAPAGTDEAENASDKEVQQDGDTDDVHTPSSGSGRGTSEYVDLSEAGLHDAEDLYSPDDKSYEENLVGITTFESLKQNMTYNDVEAIINSDYGSVSENSSGKVLRFNTGAGEDIELYFTLSGDEYILTEVKRTDRYGNLRTCEWDETGTIVLYNLLDTDREFEHISGESKGEIANE